MDLGASAEALQSHRFRPRDALGKDRSADGAAVLLRDTGQGARLRAGRCALARAVNPDEMVCYPVFEVQIGQRGVQAGTHLVDVGLALGARKKLLAEGLRVGYGVQLGGAVTWDGCTDANAIDLSAATDLGPFVDACCNCVPRAASGTSSRRGTIRCPRCSCRQRRTHQWHVAAWGMLPPPKPSRKAFAQPGGSAPNGLVALQGAFRLARLALG